MLTSAATQWAAKVCQTIPDIDDQWHSFLRAMAVAGVEQWLYESATPVTVNYPRSVAPRDDLSLQAGDLRLCILSMGVLTDSQVTIPVAAVDGDNQAHLYVVVEVHEEIDQVQVVAGLRHDQLQQYLQSSAEVVDTRYVVPMELFTLTPDQLLWYVNCLQPEAIIPAESGPEPVAPVEAVVSQVINTAQWLQGRLDAVAEQLEWQLMPSLVPSYGLRGVEATLEDPVEALSPILATLKRQGVDIPATAVGTVKQMQVGETVCRVYALLWELPETQEWSLFVLLGPVEQQLLPVGMVLQVSDETAVMSRKELGDDAMATFLYIQAIGYLDEQFVVEIGGPDGATVVLPRFGFGG